MNQKPFPFDLVDVTHIDHVTSMNADEAIRGEYSFQGLQGATDHVHKATLHVEFRIHMGARNAHDFIDVQANVFSVAGNKQQIQIMVFPPENFSGLRLAFNT
jgi:hypothetical protein